MKPKISTVITDIDNTLFDWVELWYKSFDALLNQLAVESGVDRAILEAETRQIFIRHRTSEYGLLLYELPSLRAQCALAEIPHAYHKSIAAYREAYRTSIFLYPTVFATLQTLRTHGCRIVAYTESLPLYTIPRMKYLGLDKVIDYLYCPPDEEISTGNALEQLHKPEAEDLALEYTECREVPSCHRKPDPEVLRTILNDLGVCVGQAVYVGDNLMKDIDMAQRAGVRDVYAQYGAVRASSKYRFLQRMSHWTDDDVQRDRCIYEQRQVQPTYVLTRTFSQLLEHFTFEP